MHEIVVHLAIAFDHFTQGGLDLVGRHLLGILVVGQVEITAVGAHATVGADLQPGPQPGPAGFFQCGRQGLAVHVQFLHFGVIQLAAFHQRLAHLFDEKGVALGFAVDAIMELGRGLLAR